MWKKQGRIFTDQAQLPVVDEYRSFYRIYYSHRIDGKSLPFFLDVEKSNPKIILQQRLTRLLELGKPGSFDVSGVMPTDIITHNGVKYLYYVGWTERKDVPYHNSLGLAISYNMGETWHKLGTGEHPVLSTNIMESGFIGTAGILVEDNKWKMYYSSCHWEVVDEKGTLEPVYDIKLATSKDGITWNITNKICIELEEGEGGISSARVIKNGEKNYVMYFSTRLKKDYRTNPLNSYRIQKATSKNGIDWKRNNEKSELIPSFMDKNFDSEMCAYPFIVKKGDGGLLMFYNGNGFGKTGIGYATLEK